MSKIDPKLLDILAQEEVNVLDDDEDEGGAVKGASSMDTRAN